MLAMQLKLNKTKSLQMLSAKQSYMKYILKVKKILRKSDTLESMLEKTKMSR